MLIRTSTTEEQVKIEDEFNKSVYVSSKIPVDSTLRRYAYSMINNKMIARR